jgi:transcriptional antiterminator RfaH
MDKRSIPDVYKWYPVYTHPKAEKKAHEALLAKGIDAYLPLRRQLRQWSDRKKWIDEPLIKSYLFVRIRQEEQSNVLMTKGITRFIYFGGKIASMPQAQIDDLRLLLASSLELEITEENLLPGERIKVKAGPLKGMVGEVVSYQSQKQLVLRLESLGCSVIIHASASLIDRL